MYSPERVSLCNVTSCLLLMAQRLSEGGRLGGQTRTNQARLFFAAVRGLIEQDGLSPLQVNGRRKCVRRAWAADGCPSEQLRSGPVGVGSSSRKITSCYTDSIIGLSLIHTATFKEETVFR